LKRFCRISALVFLICVHGMAGGIVSLLPSVTDMVVDLGSANRLVGITRYGVVPAGISVTRLGGMYDLNVEAVLRLKPGLVLAYHGVETRLKPVEDAGIPVEYLKINTLNEVLSSYQRVGQLLGKAELAKKRVAELKAMLEAEKKESGPKPSVLLVTSPGGLASPRIYVSANSFYGNLLSEIGAKNAVQSKVAYPALSREGLLAAAPDIIILLSEKKEALTDCQKVPFSFLKACRNNAAFNVYGARMMHPGPMVFQLLPILKRILKAYAEHSTASLPKHIKLRNILNSVDFSAKSGEFIGIVGPNGSGKTTLLRCVAGILRDFSGKIDLDGQNLAELSSRQVARLVSYVPQIVETVIPFTVIEFLRLSRFPYQGMGSRRRCRILRVCSVKWEFFI